MKKTLFFCLFAAVSCLAFADWFGSSTNASINSNGEIVVDNSNDLIEDRIRIINETGSDLEVIVSGEHPRKGIITLSERKIKAHDTEFLKTKYDDDLDDFKNIIFSLKEGYILSFGAKCIRDDLHFTISDAGKRNFAGDAPAADPAPKASASSETDEVAELQKWKGLLDSGAITEEEYNKKKKQILGF
ncbi:MAG: SHOCT domain-containing protein [Treponema sp.]|nr:SHOCT domain-containing protein [Treponema sp.]